MSHSPSGHRYGVYLPSLWKIPLFNLTFSCSTDCLWTLQYASLRETWLHLPYNPLLGSLKRAKRSRPAPQLLLPALVAPPLDLLLLGTGVKHKQHVTGCLRIPGGKDHFHQLASYTLARAAGSWWAPTAGRVQCWLRVWPDSLLTHFPGTMVAFSANQSRVLMDCWKG